MISIDNVTIIKSGKKLLENFSWNVQTDEHWVISGDNGSGKTILLELIAGTSHATHGEVIYSFITGTTWDERFAQRKEKIHYIPAHAIQTFLQGHELFYQQRYYSIGDERIPRVRDLFGEAIEQLYSLQLPTSFSIDELLDLELTRLSNGQLKKVLILKNLAQSLPQVLLFDYPFEGLDHDSREHLIEFLDQLAKHYSIQLILVDYDHHLPSVINKRLVLDQFKIKSIEDVSPSKPEAVQTIKNPKRNEKEIVVEMKDVTIRYGEKEIISNFNWTINKGQRWALTGRNGSGKTTIFSLIFADHPMAYSEQVYLFGKRRGSGESIWDIKKRINYLGPELLTYLNPKSLTISSRAYILQHHKNINHKTLDSSIKFFEAENFINEPIRSLSSGQLQLMLVINSLLSDRELILLDEPFQFLDQSQKAKLNQYLSEHLHPETTLVLITHYEQDILRWTAHRMILPN